MQLSGLPFGLASEGSFGPDPMVGMFPWNVELLIFLIKRKLSNFNVRHRGEPLHRRHQPTPVLRI